MAVKSGSCRLSLSEIRTFTGEIVLVDVKYLVSAVIAEKSLTFCGVCVSLNLNLADAV